ncbi:hypothetical protein FA95DRAFT_1574135 [Auriscalpium vulgare]|uniref:Uncharacterized protein n=1 Tax=Auriscalpium vulgare TaxID=40419 RepID=A0ACB8RMD1_9AGAM|nr:hypothetical protein FA95DRAFT_1574135 [Auriscalpium vulgare]
MAYRSRIFSPPPPLPRAPPKEVFPEESRGPNGLQLTTIFWETNIRFHAHAHACWMVGGRFEVFECKATHVSTNSTAPPHAGYWQHIPSKGSRVGTPESTPSSSSPPRYNEPSPRGHVLTPMRGTSHASDALQASALAQAYPTSQSVPSDSYLRGRAFGAHRPERASWSWPDHAFSLRSAWRRV